MTFKKKVIYNMPKATCKTKGEDDGDIPLCGAINEEEAKCYSQNLDSIINELGTNIRDEALNAMKEVIQRYQEAIDTMVPGMEAADPNIVWKTIKDKVGLSICPLTEEKAVVGEPDT